MATISKKSPTKKSASSLKPSSKKSPKFPSSKSTTLPIRVLVTCFDVSGDHNVADLIVYARKNFPKKFHFITIAGEQVAELAKEKSDITLLESQVLESSIGLLEGIPYVISTLKFFGWFKNYLKAEKVDVLFCVDGQGRNIKLAELAKEAGIKNVYYFPPQVSIYGAWNAKKLKDIVDVILCPFQTDHQIYQEAGANSVYTGHPFGELKLPNEAEREKHLSKILPSKKLPPNSFKNIKPAKSVKPVKPRKLISIFPGSRYQEINTLLPVFLETAENLKKEFPETEFVISCSHLSFKPLIEKYISQYWKNGSPMPIVHGKWDDILPASYFILSCSGTATLKASFLGVPHVICYKVKLLSYLVGRFIVKVNHIGMANILAGREICKEFINKQVTVRNLTEHVAKFLGDEKQYLSLKQELMNERENWKTPDPSKTIFSEILNLFK